MPSGYNFSKNTLILSIAVTVVVFLLGQVGVFKDFYVVSSLLVASLQDDSYRYFAKLESDLAFIEELKTIRNENQALKEQNSSLFAENEALKLQVEDLRLITKQLQFDLPYTLEPARILKYDESDHSIIYVNKGSSAGIDMGNIVILERYLLGEVVEVNSSYSKVMLISATEILVPVVSLEHGTKGIVAGNNGAVQMTDILTEEKLEQNDTIITSGMDGKYPYGFIVGTVSEIERIESELTKSAELDTQIELDALFEVFIIKT